MNAIVRVTMPPASFPRATRTRSLSGSPTQPRLTDAQATTGTRAVTEVETEACSQPDLDSVVGSRLEIVGERSPLGAPMRRAPARSVAVSCRRERSSAVRTAS
jgi:hypothetical protein